MISWLTKAAKIFTSQLRIRPEGGGVLTMDGNVTLDGQSSNFLRLDPAGSNRTVTLPAVKSQGNPVFMIYNAADAWGEIITVQDAAASAKAALNRAEACVVASDGSDWNVYAFDYKDFATVGLKTDVIAESTAAAGVTIDGCLVKDGRAAALATAAQFVSVEQTGTGSEQDIAHGLASTPTTVFAFFTELDGNAADLAYGTHDGTNAKITATSGQKYRVVAFL